VAQQVKTYLPSLEPKSSLQCSEEPATSPCTESDETNSDPHVLFINSRDSSVGTALCYGLDDRAARVRFPAGAGNLSFTTASRTALGPTQPPIQWVTGAIFLGVKRPVRETDHSSPSMPRSKNEWRYIPIPQYAFNFTFTSVSYLL
jgi:hypothetical protein